MRLTVLRRRNRERDCRARTLPELLALAKKKAKPGWAYKSLRAKVLTLAHGNVETNISSICLALCIRKMRFYLGIKSASSLIPGLVDWKEARQFLSDIVGWTTKTITEDDVGKSYVIFTSIEVKRQSALPTPKIGSILCKPLAVSLA